MAVPPPSADDSHAAAAAVLKERIGKAISLSFDVADLARHIRDFVPTRPTPPMPLAVAYPRDTGEVSRLLAAASALGLPVVTQGGLTGMAGGAVPTAGCLILSLEKMRGVEEIDLEAATITVRAGTPLQTVQEAAAEAGMLFALDLGARGSCTIGGNIATNAGGNRVLRYGMMRDMVLGLEVVLADGTVLTHLNKMLKNNAGYDLKNLFIGSEGTLGVVTRAVLRLHPSPTFTETALLAVADFSDVLSLLKLARATLGPLLSAFEVMWRDFYTVALAAVERAPLPPEAGGMFILLDMMGSDEAADAARFARFLEEALDRGLVADAVVAQSLGDTARLWAVRDASGELPRLWGACVNFDISVPIGSMADFVADCRAALTTFLATDDVLLFGHVADSNLHIACRDPEGAQRERIDATVYQAVRRWQGSVSAEHGIGMDKADYLGFSRSAAEIEAMRRIKDALDPKGILNPGKVLASEG